MRAVMICQLRARTRVCALYALSLSLSLSPSPSPSLPLSLSLPPSLPLSLLLTAVIMSPLARQHREDSRVTEVALRRTGPKCLMECVLNASWSVSTGLDLVCLPHWSSVHWRYPSVPIACRVSQASSYAPVAMRTNVYIDIGMDKDIGVDI